MKKSECDVCGKRVEELWYDDGEWCCEECGEAEAEKVLSQINKVEVV